jgi:hypothetical protein
MTDYQHTDVLIIGGGASGMMAAIAAAEQGARVLLIEKNKRLGEKLRITGGGRCNIYNAEEDVRILLKHYGTAEKFLYSAFAAFGVPETKEFFDSIKLPTKVEARNRAFPVSERAVDVVHALTNRMHRLGVQVLPKTNITNIEVADGLVQGVICGMNRYTANIYILATGGTSRPETGSTGDGFAWLSKFGHTTKDPTPTITPIAIREDWLKTASGVSVPMSITYYTNGEKAFRLEGDVLCTHFGLSGPLILNNAYRVADLLQAGDVTATIDFFPLLQANELDKKLQAILNENGAKLLKNTFAQCVPAGIAPALKQQMAAVIDFETKCSEVSKATRQLLVHALKQSHITVEKLMGFEKAVVADGGVDLKEIDMRTMRSNKVNNLHITGDLLNINRPSGGYSLQLCWTTGYLAGAHAAKASLLLE